MQLSLPRSGGLYGRLSLSAGRTVHEDRAVAAQAPEAMEDESVLDLMAFPENVFACVLEALPPEQLLNVSRVRLLLPCSPLSSRAPAVSHSC